MMTDRQTKSMLKYALRLHQMGFWVIPLAVRGKHPFIDGWDRYSTTRPTEAEIRKWWTDTPNANIGLLTGRGSRFVVLDIDNPALLGKYLKQYPTAAVAKTGKGGYHLYYMYPPGHKEPIPNRAGIEEGVDFRGDNGIIVMPPSVHENGNRYAWHATGTPEVLPDQLLKRVYDRSSAPKPTEDEKWVSNIIQTGSRPGQRNSDMTRLVGYFLSKSIPRDVVLQLVKPWFDRTDQTDFSWREVERAVESVSKRELSKPPTSKVMSSASVSIDQPSQHVSAFTDFIRGPEFEIAWAIAGWLPVETTGLIVAPPGSYKTWIMLAMALALSTGTPLFNEFAVNKRQPVLIIQQEDAQGIVKQRLRTVYSQMLADSDIEHSHVIDADGTTVLEFEVKNYPPPPALDVFVSPMLVNFADDKSMELLEALIKEKGYKLVIIDPLYAAAGSTDQYMNDVAPKMMVLKFLRNKYGCSFIILHHTKKAMSDSVERMDAWGSQFINAWLEAGIQVRQTDEPNKVKIHRHFKSAPTQEARYLEFDIDTDPEHRKFVVTVTDTPMKITPPSQVQSPKDVQRNNIIDVIRRIGGKVTIKQIQDYLEHEYGVSMADNALRGRLSTIIKSPASPIHKATGESNQAVYIYEEP